MKFKAKKSGKSLSEKIADALTVKPRPDIEDDQEFGTKPKTLSRVDFSSSDSEDDNAISDFRKRNVNLLSDISKKYEGKVVTKNNVEESDDISEDDEENSTGNNLDSLAKLFTSAKKDRSSHPAEESASDIAESHSGTDESLSEEEGESDDYSITQTQANTTVAGSSDDEDGENDEEDDDDDEEEEGFDISQMDEPPKENFEHLKKQNVSEEAKKGACVRNQLFLWEGLLEIRIHLQRCLNTANQMPMPEFHNELKNNIEFSEECNTTKSNISNTLDKLLTLQGMLLKKFPETKSISTQSTKDESKKPTQGTESDEEIPSDTEDEEIPSDTDDEKSEDDQPAKLSNTPTTKKRKLEDYEKEVATCHKAFKSFRDTTIQKWNEKTRQTTSVNLKNAPANTILQQISYILSDKDKLVRRTQLKRSEFDIIGYKKPAIDEPENNTEENPSTKDRKDNDEYIPEIFDDSDFYHQLLRELIECKSADISDPVQLSRQWIALQQMRSKMKRKVDTKATKGRKIRYVVHNQLVNYMAPEKCLTWSAESANELYSSLFGKMFEQNNGVPNVNIENGFRIK